VEAPLSILGKFDDSFLELPKEILTTVCQIYLSVVLLFTVMVCTSTILDNDEDECLI
jgi:hypothetical protein